MRNQQFKSYHFFLIFLILLTANYAFAEESRIVFLHHSTGGNLCEEGKVSQWFDDYNSIHDTSYQFLTRSYPGLKPEPMFNYPYNYWNLWVNGACQLSSQHDRPCLDKLTREYDVIIYKHCYPGSDIQKDTGFSQVDSDHKSLENYKLQYRALRDIMDGYSNTIFIIWTLPPRNRIATTQKHATRSSKFVKWVKNDFLSEDKKKHPNIFIFDF